MTHLTEDQFCKHVEDTLGSVFGPANVESQKWLVETTCYADFWVDTGIVVLAVEVENDADSIRNGVGQALEYAQNDPLAVPAVIVPEGHVDTGQAQALRNICPIVELGVDHDA